MVSNNGNFQHFSDSFFDSNVEGDALPDKYGQLECALCGTNFANRKLFECHVDEFHYLQCDHCDEIFEDKESLNLHMLNEASCISRDCSNKENAECNIIPAPRTQILLEHLPSKHSVTLKCDTCSKSYSSKSKLKLHREQVHECMYCKMIFQKRKALLNHLTKEHSIDCSYKCNVCDLTFVREKTLKRHKRNSHRFKCQLCSKKFVSEKFIEKHLAVKHGEKLDLKEKFQCQVCSSTYISEKYYKLHISRMHSWKCDTLFATKDLVTAHFTEKHHKSLNCDYCQLTFTSSEILQIHITKKHTLKCELCDEALRSKDLLIRHLSEKHSAGDLLECHFCNQTYSSTTSLRMHIEDVHTFKCESCNDVLLSKALLATHLSQKHRTKILKCEFCHRIFTSSAQREKHISKYHIYKSELCEEVLRTNERLAAHLEDKHLKTGSFECNICHMKFSRGKYLKHHNKTQHPSYKTFETFVI